MTSSRFQTFAALHKPGRPLILFNAWDAGSAKTIAEAGAQAIATGSAPVAGANGFPDGETLPIELALAIASKIVAAVDVPVTIDFEGGYAVAPDAMADNVALLAKTGAVGCNLEDQVVGGDGLHPIGDQARRLAAVRRRVGDDFFVNARTDIFLKGKRETHDSAMLDAALERARAYADAGASGFFAPGLVDERLIARLCKASPLPVNIISLPGAPSNASLADVGVARISYGPGPWRLAMQAVADAARKVYA